MACIIYTDKSFPLIITTLKFTNYSSLVYYTHKIINALVFLQQWYVKTNFVGYDGMFLSIGGPDKTVSDCPF